MKENYFCFDIYSKFITEIYNPNCITRDDTIDIIVFIMSCTNNIIFYTILTSIFTADYPVAPAALLSFNM